MKCHFITEGGVNWQLVRLTEPDGFWYREHRAVAQTAWRVPPSAQEEGFDGQGCNVPGGARQYALEYLNSRRFSQVVDILPALDLAPPWSNGAATPGVPLTRGVPVER